MYCLKNRKTNDPLRGLRIKLFLLNLIFVGGVVLTLCFFGVRQTLYRMEGQHREIFAAACTPLQNSLSLSQTIDHKAIYQYVAQNDLLLFLFDGKASIKSPYFTDSTYEMLPEKSAPFLDVAWEQMNQQSGSWLKVPVFQDFTLKDKADLWFARYIAIPLANGDWMEAYLFQNGQRFLAECRRLWLMYLGLACMGIAVLGSLSFLLTTWAMQPAWHAQQAEHEFIAAASHELKSPLTVITTAAELLPKGDLQTEQYRSHILSESRRMSALIRELFLLSKSEIIPNTVQSSEIDTEAFLWGLFEKWQGIAAKAFDTLLLDFPEEALPSFYADEEMIQQAFSVLLSNAIEHTPQGTMIRMGAKKERRMLAFFVSDNGPGIKEKEKAFEKFYRENRTVSSTHFGLGLSIAQKIVLSHRGKIEIQDTPGGGATILFTIPAVL